MKNKTTFLSMAILSLFLLSSCGSNSKPDGGATGSVGSVGVSIAYISTEYDATRGYIDHYRIHATDSSGNPISGLSFRKSIVNGVKKIRNQKLQINKGGIESSTPINFFDSGIDFSKTGVRVGDNLIVVPSSGKTNPSYLGDWSIKGVGSGLTLTEGSFNLENTDGLTYIIGSEQRFLGSSGRGRVATAHIETPASTGTTDADGFSYFDVVYDPVLGRHTVTLGIHTSGNRRSAAKVAGLRGGTIDAGTFSFLTTGGTNLVYKTAFIKFGESGSEHYIDQTIDPSSIKISPAKNCRLNIGESNFHTDGGGRFSIAVDAQLDVNTTEPVTCSIDAKNLTSFLEY